MEIRVKGGCNWKGTPIKFLSLFPFFKEKKKFELLNFQRPVASWNFMKIINYRRGAEIWQEKKNSKT